MDGGAWWAAVHGVARSRTRLNDFPFTFHFHALEKEMATHSSVLAWRIPGTGEPGELPSMGSHRVRHNWSNLAAAAAAAQILIILPQLIYTITENILVLKYWNIIFEILFIPHNIWKISHLTPTIHFSGVFLLSVNNLSSMYWLPVSS